MDWFALDFSREHPETDSPAAEERLGGNGFALPVGFSLVLHVAVAGALFLVGDLPPTAHPFVGPAPQVTRDTFQVFLASLPKKRKRPRRSQSAEQPKVSRQGMVVNSSAGTASRTDRQVKGNLAGVLQPPVKMAKPERPTAPPLRSEASTEPLKLPERAAVVSPALPLGHLAEPLASISTPSSSLQPTSQVTAAPLQAAPSPEESPYPPYYSAPSTVEETTVGGGRLDDGLQEVAVVPAPAHETTAVPHGTESAKIETPEAFQGLMPAGEGGRSVPEESPPRSAVVKPLAQPTPSGPGVANRSLDVSVFLFPPPGTQMGLGLGTDQGPFPRVADRMIESRTPERGSATLPAPKTPLVVAQPSAPRSEGEATPKSVASADAGLHGAEKAPVSHERAASPMPKRDSYQSSPSLVEEAVVGQLSPSTPKEVHEHRATEAHAATSLPADRDEPRVPEVAPTEVHRSVPFIESGRREPSSGSAPPVDHAAPVQFHSSAGPPLFPPPGTLVEARVIASTGTPPAPSSGRRFGRFEVRLGGDRKRVATREEEIISGKVEGGIPVRLLLYVNDTAKEVTVHDGSFRVPILLDSGLNHIRAVAEDWRGVRAEDTITLEYVRPRVPDGIAIASPRDGHILPPDSPPVILIEGELENRNISTVSLVVNDRRIVVRARNGRFQKALPVLDRVLNLRAEIPSNGGAPQRSRPVTVHAPPRSAGYGLLVLEWPDGVAAHQVKVKATWRARPERLDAPIHTVLLDIFRASERGTPPEVFSVRLKPGVYTFMLRAEADLAGDVRAIVYLPKADHLEARELRPLSLKGAGEWVLAKLLFPQGVFWEQDEWFSGRSESADALTKFRFPEGITWTERKKHFP